MASVAMSTILLAEGALALEVPLARLGAMACVRSKKEVMRAGRRRARETKRSLGMKGTGEVMDRTPKCFIEG